MAGKAAIGFDPYAGTQGKFPVLQIIEMAGKAGYEALNLYINEGFVSGEDAQLLEVEKALAQHKVATPTIHYGKHIVATPGKEAEALAHLQPVLKVCKRLNAKYLGIWPNLLGNPPKDASIRTLAANLRVIQPAAAEAGLTVTLEFEKNHTIDNYREGLAFLNEYAPKVKLTCDTYHLNNDKAEPYASILAMKDHLGDVHLSGSHRGEPGTEGDTIDYAALFKGLKEIGFSGPLLNQFKLTDVGQMASSCAFAKKYREQYLG
ncbi:MAG: sugar phosphate isomerase/epimerase [Planctomycetota bacterium]|nr:sugar phosphate isomerase/epimerase [Planctomycetota bacterium]